MKTIYIRQLRYVEAEQKLEAELQQAFMSGLNYIEVVHGKGNGVLRKLVADKIIELGYGRVVPEDDSVGNAGITLLELFPPFNNKNGIYIF